MIFRAKFLRQRRIWHETREHDVCHHGAFSLSGHTFRFIFTKLVKLDRFVIICIWLQGQCEKSCFAFRQLVFLPFEPNLIKPELFSDDQVHVLAFKTKNGHFYFIFKLFLSYIFFIEVVVKRLLWNDWTTRYSSTASQERFYSYCVASEQNKCHVS